MLISNGSISEAVNHFILVLILRLVEYSLGPMNKF
jgi:hypothetical protein